MSSIPTTAGVDMACRMGIFPFYAVIDVIGYDVLFSKLCYLANWIYLD
jgi:hypothetical protein